MGLLMDFILKTIVPIRKFPVSDTTMITLYAKVFPILSAVGLAQQLKEGRVSLAAMVRFFILLANLD